MINLAFNGEATRLLKVLCLGCHSDDIEIGCGGTILRLSQQYPTSTFAWIVFNACGVRETEAKRAAEMFVGAPRLEGVTLKAFPDGFMPFVGAEVKKVFEDLKSSVAPDLILTHNRKDAHQDHRLVAELTWNTFRDHLIWEYEIPKYDGDLGQPNLFVPLTAEQCESKIRYVMQVFESQKTKHWFKEDTFRSLMRLRGMECNAPSGYAEAFYCRKVVL